MRHVAICVLVLLIAPYAYAQNGTISGSVLDAGTSMPLPGDETITIYGDNGDRVLATSPDASGNYQASVAPGFYFVHVSASDATYYPQLYDSIPCVAADCPPTAGTPVVVTSGGTATVNFNMVRGGHFSGIVRRAQDGFGVQTSQLFVLVYNANGSYMQAVGLGGAPAGEYTVRNLPTGIYYARIGTPGGSSALSMPGSPVLQSIPEMYGGIRCPAAFQEDCRILESAPISVMAGSTTTGIDFVLDRAGEISGHISDALTGDRIAGVTVEAYAGQTRVGVALTADGANVGFYRFSALPPGTYTIRTAPAIAQKPEPYAHEWYNDVPFGGPGTPAPVTVASGEIVGAINIALSPAGSIAGTVRCDPAMRGTIARPIIEAISATGERVGVNRYLQTTQPPPPGFPTGCFETTYVIDGLAPGQYYLRSADDPVWPFNPFFPPGGYLINELYGGIDCVASDCDVRRGVPVSVTAGGTTPNIDFDMRGGGGFSITIDGRYVGANPSVSLSIYDARGVQIDTASVLQFVPFGPSTNIIGLPDGLYYVAANGTLFDDIACSGCPPTSGTPVLIRRGSPSTTSSIDIQTIGQRVSGTVRNAAGTIGLSSITVELIANAGTVVASASTDLRGAFRFPKVPAGTYFARTRNTRGFVDELYSELSCPTCDPRNGTPIVVASSAVSNIDFTLAPSGVVAGLATEPSGVVAANIPVALFAPDGTLVARTRTNPSGRFTFDVSSGSYRARAEASPTHAAELYSELPCTSASCDVTTGTPIAVASGATTPNVNFTLTSCRAMTLSPPVLATGVAGQSYRQVFTVSGGTRPFAFEVTDGVLPSGLTLNATSGVLAGTASASGRHRFRIGARDANDCATERALTLDVQACAFILSPASATVPAAGGTVTINILGACGSQDVRYLLAPIHVESNTPGQVVLRVDPNAGFPAWSHTITIGRRSFTIRQSGTSSQPPFGSFDAPLDGTQASGSMGLGGWALDDIEVVRVQVYRDPVGGEGAAQIFLGNAVFVRGARPDVARAYPSVPLNDQGGWGFLILTNMLPNQGNGVFRIYAYADDAEGNRTLLGAKTIVAANAGATDPFGAIDTPQQGATISGTGYLNFGWALTPQPKIIPFDGSTIHVMVDGVSLGHPTYNQFRSDIAALFPGFANSNGAVGYLPIDTTALAEGQHTFAWIVYDNLEAGAGIGSRYFNVTNSADAQPADQGTAQGGGAEGGRRTESLASMPMTIDDVRLKPDATDESVITLGPLERLELPLETSSANDACAATWAGYSIENKTLGKLPVGATIDPSGTFYWQPGPGFHGTFELMFVRTACDGSKSRTPLTVTIRSHK
jgi:hypothetical protein